MDKPVTGSEERIMRQVGILDSPAEYALIYRDKDTIRLRHHKTRDIVTIHRGDRPWPKE